MWDALKSDEYTPEEKWGLLLDADANLGLSLASPPVRNLSEENTPQAIRELLTRREAAREKKDYAEADRLRGEIAKGGYRVEDGAEGATLSKLPH